MKPFLPDTGFHQPLFVTTLRTPVCTAIVLGMLALGATLLYSQTPVRPPSASRSKSAAAVSGHKIAAIKSFRIVQEKDGPAIEILSTRPLVPAIQKIGNPDRLVIDLPNARLRRQKKKIRSTFEQMRSVLYGPSSFNKTPQWHDWWSTCSRRGTTPGMLRETFCSCISARILTSPPLRHCRRPRSRV